MSKTDKMIDEMCKDTVLDEGTFIQDVTARAVAAGLNPELKNLGGSEYISFTLNGNICRMVDIGRAYNMAEICVENGTASPEELPDAVVFGLQVIAGVLQDGYKLEFGIRNIALGGIINRMPALVYCGTGQAALKFDLLALFHAGNVPSAVKDITGIIRAKEEALRNKSDATSRFAAALYKALAQRGCVDGGTVIEDGIDCFAYTVGSGDGAWTVFKAPFSVLYDMLGDDAEKIDAFAKSIAKVVPTADIC